MGLFCWTGCFALCLQLVLGTALSHLPACNEGDFHYEYTECDSTGSRWRVAVPNLEKQCVGLPDPVKGKDCTFSCDSGQFLDIKTQSCTECAAGTYSLGTGIKFDEWDEMPSGFSNVATFMETTADFSGNRPDSCDNSSWIPRGNYIESNRDDCTVSLIYAVHLKKAGSVSFDYQYVDNNMFFEFFIQNDQCQETSSASEKWVKLSENSEWMHHSVALKSGTNILYWRTTGILLGSKVVKPVLIKNITIEGVAYTSECFPCKPGTYSDTPGSSFCKICPRNTYSDKGARECNKCKQDTQYSDEGASKCLDRPPCSNKDTFQIHTPCDNEGKTQVIYKWIEPKICREDMPDAMKLPASGTKEDCPPCNPGFYSNGTSTCSPCPFGTFSDGMQECKPCAAGTEPILGFEYKWWNVLPANMKTSCFNVGNSKCDGMNGWEVAGDHVQSGAGGSDNDYLLLNLHIPGFKPPTSGANVAEMGRITFVFETICSADCVLYFMVDVNRKTTSVVESWGGNREKQSYTHIIAKNATYMFTWAFQRTNQAQDDHSACYSDCTFSYMHENQSLIYNFNNLSSVGTLINGPSFTSKGTKYFHLFNISLCGNGGEKMAVCTDNITDVTTKEMEAEAEDVSNFVKTFVCQSTIIPSDSKGFRTALSSQSVSLADAFLGGTIERSLDGITIKPEMFPFPKKIPDINFFYKSSAATSSCEKGRATVISMRCDPSKPGQGDISVSRLCPAGTCDGCNFYFLWETAEACPFCTENDYQKIEGACKNGHQETHYVWNEPRICMRGVPLPDKRTAACESIDFWLKVGAGVGAFVAVLLVALTCYFWKKNQKLEYKYSKLIMTANSKECELPAPDSCAIMEGEDNDDDVVYSNKQSLLGKLKSLATKEKEHSFESVQLKSSRPQNI
ncbi:hypothetical protein GDO81_010050 [Engystomops pustulosus]|uniref:MRH domain-containing protein n=1 Tax=Engystomops pustulosus TaxID=76066 RepID=A0AAV7BXP2_ENGPU|nr:hypothetical protein GDO81_010050 [Engystomops pustulosus]